MAKIVRASEEVTTIVRTKLGENSWRTIAMTVTPPPPAWPRYEGIRDAEIHGALMQLHNLTSQVDERRTLQLRRPAAIATSADGMVDWPVDDIIDEISKILLLSPAARE